MTSGFLRWIGGGILLGFIVWGYFAIVDWREDLREEGREEVTKAIQQENINSLQQERELTSRVLVEREKQRAVNDATSTQTRQAIHKAKTTAYDIDSPLPDVIANPLRLQWEAINCGQGGEDTPSCRVVDGKAHP